MMRQFREIKAKYPDALLLFRCGDFYETYCEDAVLASRVLEITLTHRSNGASSATPIDMAGFPFHALDTYLPRLVRKGIRVAICDQLEDPKLTKTLVKRGVTELVTPGVSYSDTTLEQKENNFLCCIQFAKTKAHVPYAGVSFLDLSTGEFLVAEGGLDYVDKLLTNFHPKELLYMRGKRDEIEQSMGTKVPFHYELDDWMLTMDAAQDRLYKQFGVQTLKGFGLTDMPEAIVAAGGILHYLDITQHLQTAHVCHLSRIEEDRYVWLDRFTVRNLEIYDVQHEGGKSLLDVLDNTVSAMGGRMMRRWVALPLKSIDSIRNRQDVVKYMYSHPDVRDAVRDQLSQIQDVERIVSKVATGRISPREILVLGQALTRIERLKTICMESDEKSYMHTLGEQLTSHPELRERIEQTISPDAPSVAGRLGVIGIGVDKELDELRSIQQNGQHYLIELQEREVEATGIQSLKIGFNSVFGYYLEVRNTHRDLVPQEWIRKQTLVNAERYITPELKEYENKIINAEAEIAIIENRIYQELVLHMMQFVPSLQINAGVLAQLDCLQSFAITATNYKYVCPVMTNGLELNIIQGRHPVIERQLPIGEQYVANDVSLSNQKEQILMLTGPNMAGKSAFLRQTALIVLMAQIGSFVPAESAQIGVVDKIFTRVGASDNISAGESTFMVEMTEAASILNNLSERSLVLFDELGRGTSTYDGISIAWSIVEYIHENRFHAKTLFATHYHELNEMESTFSRIRNYNVSVREVDGKVIFLRKLVRGGSEHSFGIHVAKLAGMPTSIVERANQILADLEGGESATVRSSVVGVKPMQQIAQLREGMQLSFFQLDDPVLEQIRDQVSQLDINNLTPLEALNRLSDIKKLVGGK